MTRRFAPALFASALLALALAILPARAAAGSFTEDQKKEIGDIVRQYLIENPDVLLEVSRELENRQQAEESSKRAVTLAERADELFRLAGDPVAGNPQGDVTLVEFFDYNCGWCKRGLPEVLSLVESDKNLRVVLKEFPIFGGDSDYAAKAALASQAQGKYWDFHVALLSHEGKLTAANVDEIARDVGLDLARLKEDMSAPEVAATIRRNQELAQALAINGTPAFVIDKTVVPGYLPKDGLMAAIGEVRSNGGCQLC